MNSTPSNFENDSNQPDNVGDSNLSESMADVDLDASSSSEDKRSRQDSEVAAEETDQSSPPTKRQRRDEDEEEEAGEDASEQRDVIDEEQDYSGDGSQQRPILIDDVDHSEDASQRHDMVQDDAEIGSSLEDNVNSSPDDERNNEEPLPLRPANTDTNTNSSNPDIPFVSHVPSSNVSIAEGSMISIDIPIENPPPPPLITPEEINNAIAARLRELDDAQDYYEAVMLEVWERRGERDRRGDDVILDRLRAIMSPTPRPQWRTGIRNQPDPRSFVTGMEYIRHVLSELNELSDDEEW
ncbi:hypothetical protein CEP54_001906 [Fusarium duplospermum]|uniref:Uncharacterized protein n=1 Tax=Fusarium duplospermum TaxID=1325734 RepID=A0A428QYU4_9HYPO|nr:hypothetical protein CEP54_001906 [Fusarium duplospermum]